MATAAKKRAHAHAHERASTSSPGSGLDELLSGKVTARTSPRRKARKAEKIRELLPAPLRELADIFVAGKKARKEIEFKVDYAEHQLKEYCLKRFCEKYVSTGKRPEMSLYSGKRSEFSYVVTRKTYLNPDKVEALRELGVDVNQHTELKGLRINYEVIREQRLEGKLRQALEGMGLGKELLTDLFEPAVQLKDSFFEILDSIVKDSLRQGEKLDEKMLEVLRILQPVHQIKNTEIPKLDAKDCFELVHRADIDIAE